MTKPRQWQPMFDGKLGLKQGYAITNMPPGSVLDIKNMYLNGLGGKVSRNGYTELFHTTEDRLTVGTITGSPVDGATLLQTRLPDAANATGVYRGSGTGYIGLNVTAGAFSPVQGSFNETTPVGATNQNWASVASDADGSHLIAAVSGGNVYITNNTGTTWTELQPGGAFVRTWTAVGSNSTGTKLLAAYTSAGAKIMRSIDSGATWGDVTPAGTKWASIASDEDGSHWVVGESGGGTLWTSTDSGATWSSTGGAGDWRSVASDATGMILIAGNRGARLWTTISGGAGWVETRPNGDADFNWSCVASDTTGAKLVAGVYGGRLWRSTNSGTSWTEMTPAGAFDKNWMSITSDADGTNLMVGEYGGRLWISTNSGTSWTETTPAGVANKNWMAVSGGSTGSSLLAAVYGGRVYRTNTLVVGTNPDTSLFYFTPTALISASNRLTDKIRSLIQYNPFGTTAQELCYAGTKMFKKNGTYSTVIRSGLTDDTPWEWIQYRNFILGVNGTDSSLLYGLRGASYDYTKIGMTAPTTHLTATIGAGGTLAVGVHSYLMTNYDSVTGRESNPFTVSTAPSVTSAGSPGNATANLSAFPTVATGEGVTHRRIYRKSPSETLYSRIVEITVATTTYADTGLASTSLYLDYDTGAADTGNTPPPASSIIAEQFDRIFMVDPTDPSILIFSKVGDYWSFPVGNIAYVGRGDGSRIKRIEKHGKALLIHKGNGWYILESDPVGDFTNGVVPGVIKHLSAVGTQDFRTSISAHNQVVRLTPVGFYRSTPTEYSTTDLREDYIGNDVNNYESNLNYEDSAYISMYNYNAANRRHVYYIEPVSGEYYSKCLVYDIVLEQWVYYEIGTDVYAVADYSYLNLKYMMMGDGYGIVWKWDVGDSDGHSLLDTQSNGTVTSSGATSLTDSDQILDSGTASAGTGTTLTDTNLYSGVLKQWSGDEWVDKILYIVSGTGAGQSRTIVSNTAHDDPTTPNQITVAAWTTPPANDSVYQIGNWDINSLVGCVVSLWDGTGASQRRRILSNTLDTLTVATWGTNPDTTTNYSVGGIDKYAEEYWDSNGDPHLLKRMRWVVPYIRQTGNYIITISFRKDFDQSYDVIRTVNITSSASTWGIMLWGSGVWGGQTSNLERLNLHGKYHYYSIKYENHKAGELFYWDGHGAVFQILPDRHR